MTIEAEVKKLELKPDDVVVIRLQGPATYAQFREIGKTAQREMGNLGIQKWVIVPDDIMIDRMSDAEFEDWLKTLRAHWVRAEYAVDTSTLDAKRWPR